MPGREWTFSVHRVDHGTTRQSGEGKDRSQIATDRIRQFWRCEAGGRGCDRVANSCGRRVPGVLRTARATLGHSSLRRGSEQSNQGHRHSQGALDRVEKEAAMKKLAGVSSYHEWKLKELREDREFAVEYLKAAMEALDNPEERAGGLIMLRAVAEAYGGVGAVAAQAGISRESLYRALSPKGNPTLKTLIAVLKTVGLRLSVTPEQKVRAKHTRTRRASVAA